MTNKAIAMNRSLVMVPARTIQTKHLERTTLRTSRLLDFCSRKELIAQTGHQPSAWPLVVLKELLDNGLDGIVRLTPNRLQL